MLRRGMEVHPGWSSATFRAVAMTAQALTSISAMLRYQAFAGCFAAFLEVAKSTLIGI
jgi:hypothetical protein